MSGPQDIDDFGQYGSEGTAAPTNNPPARNDAATVMGNSGKVGLFGGYGVGTGYGNVDLPPVPFNHLWRFDPSTRQWTWMSGSVGPGSSGAYGMQGVAAPGNEPSSRASAFLWIDSDRNLFLFGGVGDILDPSGSEPWNDLWEFAGANFR